MNFKNVIFFVLVFSLFVYGTTVYAHAIREDNGMSVMMHINSDDLAYTGQSNNVAFYLTYKDIHTDIKDCKCVLEVFTGDKKILSRDIVDTSNKVKMSKMAIYIIRVSGEPKVAGQFEPFSVEWDIRPEQGEDPTVLEYLKENLTILLGIAVFFLLVFFSGKMVKK